MHLRRLQSTTTSVFNAHYSLTRSWHRRWIMIASAIVTILATNGALGQSSPGIDVEYLTRQGVDERLQSDGVDLLGDSYDPSTGSVVFNHLDVSIPGNSDLEVAIRRKRSSGRRYWMQAEYDFADWEIETPRISVIVGQQRDQSGLEPPEWRDQRCTASNFLGPKIVMSDPYWVPNFFDPENDFPDLYIIEDYEYSNGVVLEIPGQPSRQLLDIGQQNQWPAGTEKVTTDNWAISCITDVGIGGGNGFIATAPNGDVYTFDVLVYRSAPPIRVANSFLERSNAFMLASSVTDVNGNWVNYSYNGQKLDTITSSDGRDIKVLYSGNLISQVKANYQSTDERTWTYNYDIAPSTATVLGSVDLPDSRSWSFDLRAMDIKADPTFDCTKADITVSVTHPNGAEGAFTFSETRHLKGDSNVGTARSRSCQGSAPQQKPYFDAMSLTQKTLSGPGYPAATWTYSYSGYTSGTVPSTKWSQVIDPLGRKSVHTFHRAGDFQGKPLKVELFATSSTSVVSQKVDYSYLAEAVVGTTYVLNENIATQRKPRRDTTTVITRGADTYTTVRTYNTTQSSTLYSHGYPTRIDRSNNFVTSTRYVEMVYAHNRTKWVLGLPSTVTKNGKLFDSYTFDSLGRFTQHNAFGNLRQKIGYHTAAGQQGTVAWVEDALTRRTQFADYFRGRPRLITRADNTTLSRTVDDNGWVDSDTDPMGVTTNYQYNDVGWLTLIDRASPWTDTTIAYSGLGGSFTQTSTRGTTRITTSYDSFTRPYLVKTAPLSGGGKTSYAKTTYDALGQVTFASLPSTSSSPADGTTTTYDELGRLKVVAENVFPNATTTYAYINVNRTKITDPEGDTTTYYYHGYGSPSTEELRTIVQPMGVWTYLDRNDYGQVYRLRQLGNHNGYSMNEPQYSYYDSSQRLCRHWTREGRYTAYAYNAANEMTSYAKGASGGSSCSTPSGSSKVSMSYDDLGRIELTDYQDTGTPDIALSYDDNGNVLTINRLASNPANDVDWSYSYDNDNNLKTEQLQLDGRSYSLSYDYTNDGRLTQRTLPSNQVVNYAFNGLGQVTSVSSGVTSYASNMAYHVNGALESANYGNGHALTKTWTARQQPLRVYTQTGSNKALDRTYGYDARGRITSVTDIADVGNNRTYGYDDLGRLTSATGPWGSGTFTYDPLANLRAKTLGTRSVTVSYDTVFNRATQSTDTAGTTRSMGYDSRGNVTTLGAMTFVYDITDQPVSQSGSVPATYVYDGNLKRAKQILGNKTIYSVYDAAGAMVHRDNTTDSKVTEYISAAGTDVRLENGTAKYTFKDHLGSPVTGTNSAGTVSWRERYTPFGEKILNPAANRDEPGYTGHIQDDATGLTYMQARYYDPVIGRFLSIDPVGFSPGRPFMFNRYAYAGNNPLAFVDPTGEVPEWLSTVGETALDFTPFVGDIKGFVDAYNDPTFVNVAAAIIGLAGPIGDGVAKSMKGAASVADAMKKLPDDASVCRGGQCGAKNFEGGTGVKLDEAGNLQNVSVNSNRGKSVEELSQGLPQSQVGVTTVGDVRKAGGDVVPDTSARNPNHAKMGGISSKQAEELFKPTIDNPSKSN